MSDHWPEPDPLEPSHLFDSAVWWTPDGLIVGDEVLGYWQEKTYEQCPYYIASHGGPKDLPGKYGPGTCMGGCWDEPQCMT